jgi:7-carboxy-7-deazaguanine synthase
MPYGIKEVFLTLQGEGARAGAKSVFVRTTGCNLWSGNPAHRDRGAGPCARWCDTDFFKGEVVELEALRERMRAAWGDGQGEKWCVITGGEPALQIDQALVDALHADGWRIAVETNGTIDTPALRACDHVCASPKRGTPWSIAAAHEIKIVLPGAARDEDGWTDDELVALEREAMAAPVPPALFVQPQDPIAGAGELEHTYLKRARDACVPQADALERAYRNNLERCMQWVMKHGRWRLSAQLHKYIRIA